MISAREGLSGSCHRCAVSIDLPAPPEHFRGRNSSLCTRTGALWAYESPAAMRLTPGVNALDAYVRADVTEACFASERRATSRVGVNLNLLEPAYRGRVEVREVDRRSWLL